MADCGWDRQSAIYPSRHACHETGLRFIGQGDAVTFAHEQVGVDNILTVNRKLLDSGRLSEFTMKYATKKEWLALMADPYWKAPNISVPLFDLHDAHDSATYYE